ncbi:hypothetical protein Aduo_004880 [Ancylostoma duodenale]
MQVTAGEMSRMKPRVELTPWQDDVEPKKTRDASPDGPSAIELPLLDGGKTQHTRSPRRFIYKYRFPSASSCSGAGGVDDSTQRFGTTSELVSVVG